MKVYKKEDYGNQEIQTDKKYSFLSDKVIHPSKVIIIDEMRVTILEYINGLFSFKVDADFALLSNGIKPEIDITANTPIEFDEDITINKIKSIIRRCGILEKYKGCFVNDPEIIINSYSLILKKEYQFFDEFKDGVLIAEEIFE